MQFSWGWCVATHRSGEPTVRVVVLVIGLVVVVVVVVMVGVVVMAATGQRTLI